MVVIREKVLRPKGVTGLVDKDGAGNVRAVSGSAAPLAVTQTEPGFTPLELLDAALAGCLAISIRHAAKQHGWLDRLGDVSVTILHEKATDLPSRITGFDASYDISGDFSPEERATLIEAAHNLCTVGNTLTNGARISDV